MHTLWKMKFSEKQKEEILQETRELLKDINQDHLVNWKA